MGKISDLHNPYKIGAFNHAAFTIGAEATNAITVNGQLQSSDRRDIAERASFRYYLSDDANGDSVVATALDTAVAAGTDGHHTPLVTGKAGFVTTEADGDFDLVLTHTAGAKTCYLVVVLPGGGLVVSDAITFAA